MNRNKLMRRLSVVAALLAVLAVAAGTPVLQAQPEAGTISTGAGVQVWNGHNCPANIPVNISGLSAGLGGYETRIAWPAGRFDNTPANVVVALSNYLTNSGARINSSTPPGTTPLKAVSGDTVKFGDYSWGTGNPAGNTAVGQLATVALLPTATCGAAALTMLETQLVDVNGGLIGSSQNAGSVNVLGRYNIDGDAIPVVMPFDVLAVVGKVGQPTSNSCGTGYQYNVDGDAIPVVMPFDVLAVVAKVGQTTCQ